ncbi:MAG: SDR family oxidoreductase [Gemmatimonadota bacterium]|nr:SDR family oxidoreductase [Gemmatimonadota bacterium]
MSGKTCVITGSNTGIGKAAAEALASLGARIIMVCRDRARGEAAMSDVARAAETGARGGAVELFFADLSSQAQIRAVAGDILRAHPTIDVLVNNAGLALNRRELTVDGIERTFAVNYLAYFMLAHLLLPGLRASSSARIINVASEAHRRGKIEFDNLQGERSYTNVQMYSSSKLQDVMFTYALSRRLAGSGITVNTLHPGVVATEIWREIPILRTVGRWFMVSAEKGARTTVYLAASPDVEGVTGVYFNKCQPARTTKSSQDVALQEGLWQRSVALTGVEREA